MPPSPLPSDTAPAPATATATATAATHAEQQRRTLPACPRAGCEGRLVMTTFPTHAQVQCDRCACSPPEAAPTPPKGKG